MDEQILKLGVLDGYTEVVGIPGFGWVVWTHGKNVCYSQGRLLGGRQGDL